MDLREEVHTAGCRRLAVLVLNLPATSALAHASHQGWTVETELNAVQAELIHANFRALRALAGDMNANKIEPLQIPRPGTPRHQRRPTTDRKKIMRFFGASGRR